MKPSLLQQERFIVNVTIKDIAGDSSWWIIHVISATGPPNHMVQHIDVQAAHM